MMDEDGTKDVVQHFLGTPEGDPIQGGGLSKEQNQFQEMKNCVDFRVRLVEAGWRHPNGPAVMASFCDRMLFLMRQLEHLAGFRARGPGAGVG